MRSCAADLRGERVNFFDLLDRAGQPVGLEQVQQRAIFEDERQHADDRAERDGHNAKKIFLQRQRRAAVKNDPCGDADKKQVAGEKRPLRQFQQRGEFWFRRFGHGWKLKAIAA